MKVANWRYLVALISFFLVVFLFFGLPAYLINRSKGVEQLETLEKPIVPIQEQIYINAGWLVVRNQVFQMKDVVSVQFNPASFRLSVIFDAGEYGFAIIQLRSQEDWDYVKRLVINNGE